MAPAGKVGAPTLDAGMRSSLGALLATPIYSHGIWMNSLATLGFNLLALLLLRFLVGKMAQQESARINSPPA